MADLAQYLWTSAGEELLNKLMFAQRDAFEQKFKHGACGNMAQLLHSWGVGYIERVTIEVKLKRFFTQFEHYVIRTPRGSIIDPTNKYLGRCIYFDFKELGKTEAPPWVTWEEMDWLQKNVLDQLPIYSSPLTHFRR